MELKEWNCKSSSCSVCSGGLLFSVSVSSHGSLADPHSFSFSSQFLYECCEEVHFGPSKKWPSPTNITHLPNSVNQQTPPANATFYSPKSSESRLHYQLFPSSLAPSSVTYSSNNNKPKLPDHHYKHHFSSLSASLSPPINSSTTFQTKSTNSSSIVADSHLFFENESTTQPNNFLSIPAINPRCFLLSIHTINANLTSCESLKNNSNFRFYELMLQHQHFQQSFPPLRTICTMVSTTAPRPNTASRSFLHRFGLLRQLQSISTSCSDAV